MGGYAAHLAGNDGESSDWLSRARAASPEYGFPSRLEEVLALDYALKQHPDDPHARYFLGNFCFAHERFDEGIRLWEAALLDMPQFDVLLRNLGLAAWQRNSDLPAAVGFFEKALAINPQNQDLYIHLDDLYKTPGHE